MMLMRTAFFLGITQHQMVILTDISGQCIGPKPLVKDYHSMLCNTPEKHSAQENNVLHCKCSFLTYFYCAS
jgi:hypothetical protein